MRIELAEKLLIKIMQWTPEEVQQERPLLQSIANFKYDEYQQFSTGMRFIESMVKWLKQFETIEQKKISYQFIKNHLVFISGEQIAHLVALAYTEKVQPMLIEKAAIELNLNKYSIRTIVNSDIYKCYKRQTLFIGLSDGSKIDYFRRVSKINNEQVYSVYDISEQKVDDMVLKLNHDQPSVNKFNMVYLIDDFTASGRSYCRDENGGKTGKIIKFLNKVYQISNSNAKHYQKLIDVENLNLNILFYIATQESIDYIKNFISAWKIEHKIELTFTVSSIQLLNTDTNEIKEFIDICANEKYFDSSIIDEHYRKGNHNKPYLGFNECALPLVLNHNTPNNSLPILWLQEDKKFIGLFPRVTRHKE